MAGNNVTEVVVGATGKIYVGPTSATAPTNINSPLVTPWVELGFVSEDGAKLTDAKTIENIGAWQSFYPIRRILTAREFMVDFAMRQWNQDNVPFAFGGGSVVNNSGGWKFTPPDPSTIDERSLTLTWADGIKRYMLYVPRGIATANTEAQLQRTSPADLAISFSALSDGVTSAYTLFTDDPAFTSSL
jgi:hypothetical protein